MSENLLSTIARLERELEQAREQVASRNKRLSDMARELRQARQDEKEAAAHMLRALGERNDARAEIERIKAILADPLTVHISMMRGLIQWTPANLRHLLGDCQPTPADD